MSDTMVVTLKKLAAKGMIRQLDAQFSAFIARQCQKEQDVEPLALISAAVSAELGRGHICLPLWDLQGNPVDLADRLGVFGEEAKRISQMSREIDWQALLSQSSLVGLSEQQPPALLPLLFDGKRLYLHRYWHYEMMLSQHLLRLGTPISIPTARINKLRDLLDHLFPRSYLSLWQALKKAEQDGNSNTVLRQQLVCDHLDVLDSETLAWEEIDKQLLSARQVQDLHCLDTLVPESACINWQKVAAAVALTRRFAVISGGPGTGKTTTVTRLLAALTEQALEEKGQRPEIKLVAPTGKAAARLTESIGRAVDQLPVSPELKASIPTESSTLHRLLGATPDSVEFRHHRANPLHLDILVVDEASMVDLSMMYKLMEALPPHARVILLGDKDQLASVEAGAVLGDICSFSAQGYSYAQGQCLAQLTGYTMLARPSSSNGMADSLCMLQKSYRFDARSGIGQLAKAVNAGSVERLHQVWQRQFEDIQHFPLNRDHYQAMLSTLVAEYSGYLKQLASTLEGASEDSDGKVSIAAMSQKAKSALEQFNRCRLLCAVREGDFGVSGLNQRIEKALAARKWIQTNHELWYHGRPVMVTRNDYGLGLYNGDIGLCMLDESESTPRLKVYFELPDGSVKAVLPSRVPEHETAFAMTIHKSQGSEFDVTLMILPPEFSPILTRELIYTGITRAKHRLMLYANPQVLEQGIKVRTERASGLTERLG